MKVIIDIDVSPLHDIMVEINPAWTGTEADLEAVFNSLPDDIKALAYAWGTHDTEFRDQAYVHLKGDKL